ncbi:hypothetical protein PL78_02585 [Yersinia entomophaga]|uniref:Uncharacterized protein n=1 Tax=Yersinia entomophaga TaxID=935293 RepID=A0ABM6BHA4_YERET|nr:hypothetical protein PL78_02585 [Yersinia entomophaga]OWF89736.1 hypothetical protein B4914_02480 [Yersinia entomophaga]
MQGVLQIDRSIAVEINITAAGQEEGDALVSSVIRAITTSELALLLPTLGRIKLFCRAPTQGRWLAKQTFLASTSCGGW